jgi:hypothetical protein
LDAGLSILLEQAQRDAEAVAWTTGYPELVLPCLVEERQATARSWWQRQREIRDRSVQRLEAIESDSDRIAA